MGGITESVSDAGYWARC